MSNEVSVKGYEDCNQNVPSVDNSELGCDCYYNSNCIIFEEGNAFIATPSNSSVTRVIKDLINKLQIQSTRILKLEADVLALKQAE